MKILNKIILPIALFSYANTAMANMLPPITNTEIKDYANNLLKKDLPNKAEKYFKELSNRNFQPEAKWGLLLTDLLKNNNELALIKTKELLKLEGVDTHKLEKIRAEIELNLAEEAFYNNNAEKSLAFLNDYFRHDSGDYLMDTRAKELKHKTRMHNSDNNMQNLKKVNIGVILPLSGKLSNIGEQLQKTLNFAIYKEKTNNIELFFEDNKSSQEGSIEAATSLLSKNVSIIIGPILRDNTLAANTVISNTRIPLFSFSNDISIAGNNVFINNINIKQESAEIANFAIDEGYTRLTCLTPNNKYGDIERNNFSNAVNRFSGALEGCESFDSKNIDINRAIKKLLEIDKNERARLSELKKLEQEFERLGNAMEDDKIIRMAELKDQKNNYTINFNGVFIPTTAKKLLTIAPQLAFYDIDFSSGVIFLGTSSWDNPSILNNRGEHLHFTRFLSLKSAQFKAFAKDYKTILGENAMLLDGFAYDIIRIIKDINFREQDFYQQISKAEGFNVLTGNVKFINNIPNRVYGINKISRRDIKTVVPVKHNRPIDLPSNLEIKQSSGFSNWFGF